MLAGRAPMMAAAILARCCCYEILPRRRARLHGRGRHFFARFVREGGRDDAFRRRFHIHIQDIYACEAFRDMQPKCAGILPPAMPLKAMMASNGLRPLFHDKRRRCLQPPCVLAGTTMMGDIRGASGACAGGDGAAWLMIRLKIWCVPRRLPAHAHDVRADYRMLAAALLIGYMKSPLPCHSS